VNGVGKESALGYNPLYPDLFRAFLTSIVNHELLYIVACHQVNKNPKGKRKRGIGLPMGVKTSFI